MASTYPGRRPNRLAHGATGNPLLMWPFDLIDRLENASALDKPAATVRTQVQKLLSDRRVKDALHGVWLGHPLHPALVQGTLGSFLAASLIDAMGGHKRTSTAFIVTGLVLTPPTAAAGWTDWSSANPDQQRVGLVHAATNVLAISCYATALGRRMKGRPGRLPSVMGGVVSAAAATLGGHLAYHQGLGVNHTDRVRDLAPHEWQPLGSLTDLPEGTPVRREAAGTPVMLLRSGDDVQALIDRCPHLAAPLSEGEIVGTDGDRHVICPWHGSEFRLDDGCVVHGPATASVPLFETRVVDGTVQARLVESAGAPSL